MMVPAIILLGMGYLNYASCYSLGYREIYVKRSKSVAISLWVLLAASQLLVYIYWVLIYFVGPGKCHSIAPYDIHSTGEAGLSKLPEYFFCDEHGYPIWCSNCLSIKQSRTSHMKAMDRCIPKTDHFCIWVGTVIGRDNYRSFFKFMQWYLIYFIVLLVYLAIYTPVNRGLDNNFIVLYIASGFWIIMILALFISHLYYIMTNITTIDDMNIKRATRYQRWQKSHEGRPPTSEPPQRFISVDRGSFRLVMQFSVFDRCYNFGVRKNWINVMLYNNSTYFPDKPEYYSDTKLLESIVVFLVPLVDLAYIKSPFNEHRDEVTLCPKFKQYLETKITNHRCYLPLYTRKSVPLDDAANDQSYETVNSIKDQP